MGRRIPLRPVTRRALSDTLVGVLVMTGIALAASLVCFLTYGAHAGWTCLAILAPMGLLSVFGVQRLLASRARLGSIRRQLTLGGAIVLGQLLLAMVLFVALMTSSTRDGVFTAVLLAYAATVGIWGARAISRPVMGDIDELRRGLEAIGEGEHGIRMAVRGHDELAVVARDIEKLAARLAGEAHVRRRLEGGRRELLAAISHDVRTPITSLRLLSEALDDDLVDGAKRREYVSRIGVHVRALGALIDDLFELSRLEAGDVSWTVERVPLEDLVLETVDAMRAQAEAGSVSVRAELDADVEAARANPEQIQRVLFNLIQNAIRHTPADGSITVRAQSAADEVEVEVADTGEGIPVAERERVFEAFVQGAGRAARSDSSAGLGLAISRAIVEAHGGRIWIENAHIGASVRFRLPSAS